LSDRDWQQIDKSETLYTQLPSPTTQPAPLYVDSHGNQYFDGHITITMNTPAGKQIVYQLPDEAVGAPGAAATLVADRNNHLFLFNTPGRITRLRVAPEENPPITFEANFTDHVPDFDEIRRAWCDPAGRIDLVYEDYRLAIIFPTGQISPEINDKILPEDLRRFDAP
jgi:hypothetical protein